MICRALILLAAASICGLSYGGMDVGTDVGRAVEMTRTAVDHRAIATYFESKARATQAEADVQRGLALHYRRTVRSDVFRAHRWGLARTMPPLCEAAARSLESASRQYWAMAAKHRKTAEQME